MAVSTELIITRHGEAECNVAGLVGGDKTCTGLTSRGRDQVAELAARLRREQDSTRPFDVLYASPRRRAQESGQILADALSLPMITEPELVGPEHGDADGLPWDDVKTAFAGPPQAHPNRPHAQGAETWHAYLARSASVLTRLIEKHAGQKILIAGHGETIEATHTLLLELPADACTSISFQTGHASLSRWERHTNRFQRTVWMLAAHNDTAHLRP
jgi:2,3-bisphosphoglycerate-dependent phosphoglycerate mutase